MTCTWCRTQIFKKSSKKKNTENAFVTLGAQQLFNSIKQSCVMGRLGDILSWFPLSSYGCICGRQWKESASVYNKSGKVLCLSFSRYIKGRWQCASQDEWTGGHKGPQAPFHSWDAVYLLGVCLVRKMLLLWNLKDMAPWGHFRGHFTTCS